MSIRGASIKIQDLTHRYTSSSPLTFERVDVAAEAGESLVIIGRSGCGKSTLLHIVAGLLGPTSGKVLLDDAPVKGPSPHWVMMFQAPHLFPWMKVTQNVGIGLQFNRWDKAKIADRVAYALSLVNLEDYADNNVQDLSGGQQQRVALARSLVMEPEILLLDEPFSALDAFTRSSLQRDVRSISKKLGFNLVMVTHDIDEAVLMADRALIMAGSPGRIMHDIRVDLGDPRDREDPAVREMRAQLMDTFQNAAHVQPSASTNEDGASTSEDGTEALKQAV
ncbi:MAG: ABC transporter ATP-binding protein [Gammaproteobacteria bacterium]|nr:ABC transporter ATP-binding protein [Gammaproteobacteria bacterium]